VIARAEDRSLDKVSMLMIAVRVICVGAALSAVAILAGAGVEMPNVLTIAGLLFLVFPLSLVWWLFHRMGRGRRKLVYAQLAADTGVVTGIVYCTGGATSEFTVLYFVVILLASICLSMRGALLGASLAGALFVAASVVEHARHQIPGPPGSAQISAAYMVINLVLQVLSFYLVAVLSGYLSQRIGVFGARLKSTTRELQKMKMDTHSITESMSSGFVIVDSESTVTEFNRSASRMLGVPVGEAIGGKAVDVLAPVSADLYAKVVSALDEGREEERGEARVLARDGREVPLGVSVSLLKYCGATHGVVLIFQDLTDVKRMGEKMRLADKLAALGELSAAVAHEIRTPLASICGSVEMLRDSLDIRGENRRLLDLVVKESDRLKCIIDHFLEFARSRPSRFSEVSLDAVLAGVVRLVRNHPSFGGGIEVEVEAQVPVMAWVDEETIKQVFYNLALNAVEALAPGGRLTVRLEKGEREADGFAVVTFRDTGVGIDRTDLAQVFEPFFTRKKTGTGLGLAIASKIVEEHGGRIEIESKKGSGTVATVYLPRNRHQNHRICSGTDASHVLVDAAKQGGVI
jgi:two-component system sensor histidine kinase PilS (NtrC family)